MIYEKYVTKCPKNINYALKAWSYKTSLHTICKPETENPKNEIF